MRQAMWVAAWAACWVGLTVAAAEGPGLAPADAFFALHYDLHPQANDTELGKDTTYESIRAMLEKVKPDAVQYDCKGHAGYTGYPTKVGSPSPGIVNDALAIWRQVTRDMGIPLTIHYSGVWDTRAIELHPDWARVDSHGKPDANNTCRLSGYDRELMIPQLIEAVQTYDLDGVWIDGENWASRPCWCGRCAAEFKTRSGMDAPKRPSDAGWNSWVEMHRELFTKHVTEVVEAVHAVKPDCDLTSNWMYSVRQPEAMAAPIDYLSGDFDPSFGPERAAAEARFMGSRGRPWNLMAWGFLNTGGQGYTMKTPAHLCQEAAMVLAQGGGYLVYDQPQRGGRLTAWHQDLLAEVGAWCRVRQELCFRTETVPQIAILHSETSYYRFNDPLYNFGIAAQAMEGALHALLELGYSVDLLNEQALRERGERYPMIVIPEAEAVPYDIRAALAGYVQNGGRVLLSGAHVADQYPELAGVRAIPGGVWGGYLPVRGGAVTVQGQWQSVELAGAAAIAPGLSGQDPEFHALGTAAATVNTVGAGRAVAIHGPIFRGYNNGHYPGLRRFIGDCVSALDAPLIQRDGPWWVELSARAKESRTLIQLVNRSAGGFLAPNRHIVESVPNAGPFTIRIPRADAPKQVRLAPEPAGLDWSWRDGVLTAHIGGLGIHNVLVIE